MQTHLLEIERSLVWHRHKTPKNDLQSLLGIESPNALR
jgi:hypothetical protein